MHPAWITVVGNPERSSNSLDGHKVAATGEKKVMPFLEVTEEESKVQTGSSDDTPVQQQQIMVVHFTKNWMALSLAK